MAALQTCRNAHKLPWLLRYRIGLRLTSSVIRGRESTSNMSIDHLSLKLYYFYRVGVIRGCETTSKLYFRRGWIRGGNLTGSGVGVTHGRQGTITDGEGKRAG
jgi:hypothetical protein